MEDFFVHSNRDSRTSLFISDSSENNKRERECLSLISLPSNRKQSSVSFDVSFYYSRTIRTLVHGKLRSATAITRRLRAIWKNKLLRFRPLFGGCSIGSRFTGQLTLLSLITFRWIRSRILFSRAISPLNSIQKSQRFQDFCSNIRLSPLWIVHVGKG